MTKHRKPQVAPRAKSASFVPRLEVLEERWLPSAQSPVVVSAAAALLARPSAAGPLAFQPVSLHVLGDDSAGEESLVYGWSVTGPAAPSVIFAINDSNLAKDTIAVVPVAGDYTFTATVVDPQGQSATSEISVFVSLPNLSLSGLGGSSRSGGGAPSSRAGSGQPGNPPLPPGGGGSNRPASSSRQAVAGEDEPQPSSNTTASSAAVTGGQANAAVVTLLDAFNGEGIVNDGATFTGGLDAAGQALSAELLGRSITWDDGSFALGVPGANNVVAADGQTLGLPPGNYSSIVFLAVAVHGTQPDMKFTVTYTDGTDQGFTQSFSDWSTPENHDGETVVMSMSCCALADGTAQPGPFSVYGYRFTLDSSKTARSITLPENPNLKILAMNVVHGLSPYLADAAPREVLGVDYPAAGNNAPDSDAASGPSSMPQRQNSLPAQQGTHAAAAPVPEAPRRSAQADRPQRPGIATPQAQEEPDWLPVLGFAASGALVLGVVAANARQVMRGCCQMARPNRN